MLSHFFLLISNRFFSSPETRHSLVLAIVQSLKAREVPAPERLKIEAIFSSQQSQNYGNIPTKTEFILLFKKII